MIPTRALVAVLLLGLAAPAFAEEPGTPPPAPAPTEVMKPSAWQPLDDGPPPPPFAPRTDRDEAWPTSTPTERMDPFPDEPGIGYGEVPPTSDDPPTGGLVGASIPLPSEPPTKTEVVAIAKTHNVLWSCACPDKAIRLDVLFAVVGMKGEYVGATVDFYDGRGRPILSVNYPWANRQGQVSAWTKLIRIQHDARWLKTALVVPYKAFPCPPDRGSYEVEARVRLLKRRGADDYETVVGGRTTFTVHGASEGPRDWRDYTGSERRPMQSCQDRIQRFRGREPILRLLDETPQRARQLWRPYCSVPGA